MKAATIKKEHGEGVFVHPVKAEKGGACVGKSNHRFGRVEHG